MCVQGLRSLVAKEMPVPWAATTSTATGLSLRPNPTVKADPNCALHLPVILQAMFQNHDHVLSNSKPWPKDHKQLDPAQTQPQGRAVDILVGATVLSSIVVEDG